MPTTPTISSGFDAHDHAACVAQTMDAAERVCTERVLRFTAVRRRTLEILLEAHEAMGAYDVLARLNKEGFGSKPPVAYRALSFLVDAGLAHRIERLNAYVACSHPGSNHDPAFLICNSCGSVSEGLLEGALQPSAQATGFKIDKTTVEATGVCPTCVDDAPA